MGTNQALQAYEQNGGKGGLVGMTAFNQNISTQSQTGSNQGKVAAAASTGESFIQYEKEAAQGQSLKQWAGSQAFMKQAQALGINAVVAGELNNMLATTEKGITMGSPQEAEKIGQMQAYMLKGELDGLGGNPSKAEFVAATDMAKKLAYAEGVGGPAGAAIVGKGQGESEEAKWQEIGNMAGTLGRYEGDGLISKYQADSIVAKARNTDMVNSMVYSDINTKMTNMMPTLKNALLGHGKLTPQDSNFIMSILHSDPKNPMMASLKSQFLQNIVQTESGIFQRSTSSKLGAGGSAKNETTGTVGVGTGKDAPIQASLVNKTSVEAHTDYSTQSQTATNQFVTKFSEKLNTITDEANVRKIKNADQFLETVRKEASDTQGNVLENVTNPKHKSNPNPYTPPPYDPRIGH